MRKIEGKKGKLARKVLERRAGAAKVKAMISLNGAVWGAFKEELDDAWGGVSRSEMVEELVREFLGGPWVETPTKIGRADE